VAGGLLAFLAFKMALAAHSIWVFAVIGLVYFIVVSFVEWRFIPLRKTHDFNLRKDSSTPSN
jgi:hypothetical protein